MNAFTCGRKGLASVSVSVRDLQLEVRSVKDELSMKDDPRLQYFSAAATASSGKHSIADQAINAWYGGKCVLCGESGATRAHLLAGNHLSTFPDFGPPAYPNDVDIKSSKNFIPLCGNLGNIKTCHDAFDRHLLAITYNVLKSSFVCYSLNEKFEKHSAVHLKEFVFHKEHKPYKRVLAVRAKKCYNDNPRLRN